MTRLSHRFAMPIFGAMLALIPLGAAAPPARADTWCEKADYVVIGARGSGQQSMEPWGWYADTVGRAVNAFKKDVAKRFALMDRPPPVIKEMPLSDVDYPASGATLDFAVAALKMPGSYSDSVTLAKGAASRRFEAMITDCPAKTMALFVGYSQGAQVTADTYQDALLTHPDRIAGGIFYGDPYFRGDSIYGSSGRWPGSFDSNRHGGLGQRPEFRGATGSRVISTCHPDDMVCQGIPAWTGLCALSAVPLLAPSCAKEAVDTRAHNYTRPIGWSPNPNDTGDNPYDLTGEAVDSARHIGSRLGLARLPTEEYTGEQDVVLVMDSTASMRNDIDNAVKTVRKEFIENPTFDRARFGLVEYKGNYDRPSARTVVGLTEDKTALIDGMVSLRANGCCTEQVLAGAALGLDQAFRPQARKTVVLLGDEDGANPDPNQLTTESLAEKAQEKGARFLAVNFSRAANKIFSDLATATGGYIMEAFGSMGIASAVPAEDAYVVDDGDDDRAAAMATGGFEPTGDPLYDVIRGLDAYPTVEVAVSPLTFTGLPVVFSSNPSRDPVGYIANTEWDFDNDGVYEVSGKPVVTRIFDTPGTRTIGVRVTNDIGLPAVRTIKVTIYERPKEIPDRVPQAPPAPTVKARHRSLKLTVNPPTAGPASGVYRVLDTATDEVYAVIPADATGIPSTSVTVGGLDPKRVYRMAVQPENVAGFGPIGAVTGRRPLANQRLSVKPTSGRLVVSVKPELPGSWTVQLQTRSGSEWVSSPRRYRTQGTQERAHIGVPNKGRYRVAVHRQRGFPTAYSDPIQIGR